jgi:hypothetical protein
MFEGTKDFFGNDHREPIITLGRGSLNQKIIDDDIEQKVVFAVEILRFEPFSTYKSVKFIMQNQLPVRLPIRQLENMMRAVSPAFIAPRSQLEIGNV